MKRPSSPQARWSSTGERPQCESPPGPESWQQVRTLASFGWTDLGTAVRYKSRNSSTPPGRMRPEHTIFGITKDSGPSNRGIAMGAIAGWPSGSSTPRPNHSRCANAQSVWTSTRPTSPCWSTSSRRMDSHTAPISSRGTRSRRATPAARPPDEGTAGRRRHRAPGPAPQAPHKVPRGDPHQVTCSDRSPP